MKGTQWICGVLIVLFTPVVALAQNWPDFMGSLAPGLSVSPVAAALPANTTITPPDPDVPAEKAKWSGKWNGWACQDYVCDTKLAVEKVTAEGASIIYAFASDRVNPYARRIKARFVGEELQASLPRGDQIYYRMRRDDNLDFLWTYKHEWVAGILSKEK